MFHVRQPLQNDGSLPDPKTEWPKVPVERDYRATLVEANQGRGLFGSLFTRDELPEPVILAFKLIKPSEDVFLLAHGDGVIDPLPVGAVKVKALAGPQNYRATEHQNHKTPELESVEDSGTFGLRTILDSLGSEALVMNISVPSPKEFLLNAARSQRDIVALDLAKWDAIIATITSLPEGAAPQSLSSIADQTQPVVSLTAETATASGIKRASRGHNREVVMAYLTDNPPSTVREISLATHIGMSSISNVFAKEGETAFQKDPHTSKWTLRKEEPPY
ncbi:MAG: hypothetical protein J0L84_01865 [Verrucomicrobia bacterium]|nr:hypothetical protein [Verrucomicrobiota bacterium]